jgi:hypothetical protein
MLTCACAAVYYHTAAPCQEEQMATELSQECPLRSEQRPTTSFWSENFALVYADPETRTSSLFSIGTWFHDTTIWRENLAVTLPDGQVATARNFGRNTRADIVSASLCRYEILEADQAVKLSYDGPVWTHSLQELLQDGLPNGRTRRLSLELTFAASHPMWDMHAGHASDATGIAGSMHIEQLGRVNGRLQLNDREIVIRNAYSCRDHSRGGREVSKFRNHCWMNGVFSDGRGFQLYYFKMHGLVEPALSLATIMHGDERVPATIEHIELTDSPSDHGKLQTVVLSSKLGEMKIRVTDVLGTIPIHMTAPFNPAFGVGQGSHGLLFDEAVLLEWNGQRGIGWSERGFSKQKIE